MTILPIAMISLCLGPRVKKMGLQVGMEKKSMKSWSTMISQKDNTNQRIRIDKSLEDMSTRINHQ